MDEIKNIALVAHDNCKKELVEWADFNWGSLLEHRLICTGTTGRLVEEALLKRIDPEHPMRHRMTKLRSGPLGGDQQLGAMIASGEIDILIFFWDPMQPQPHDVDIRALLRIAVLYNIPTACDRSTADFVISSPLIRQKYSPIQKDHSVYLQRTL
jgi:methylglyoxal synthase